MKTATLSIPNADTVGAMGGPEIVSPLWFSKQFLFQTQRERNLEIVFWKTISENNLFANISEHDVKMENLS